MLCTEHAGSACLASCVEWHKQTGCRLPQPGPRAVFLTNGWLSAACAACQKCRYFLRGSLPWQGLQAATKKQKYEKISEKKMKTSFEALCKGFPQEFVTYFQYVRCVSVWVLGGGCWAGGDRHRAMHASQAAARNVCICGGRGCHGVAGLQPPLCVGCAPCADALVCAGAGLRCCRALRPGRCGLRTSLTMHSCAACSGTCLPRRVSVIMRQEAVSCSTPAVGAVLCGCLFGSQSGSALVLVLGVCCAAANDLAVDVTICYVQHVHCLLNPGPIPCLPACLPACHRLELGLCV